MNDLVTIDSQGNLLLNDSYVEQYKELYYLDKNTELARKEVNQKVKDYMEENDIEVLATNGLIFTYRKASIRTSLDTKKIKEDLPDIYEEYSKQSEVASSVVVKVLND